MRESEFNVQIEHLPPMRVATTSVISDTPEDEAIQGLLEWARSKHLLKHGFRLFGYDNCQPVPNHQYTTWLTIDKGVEPSGGVTIVDFPGGLYAVTEVSSVDDIGPGWDRMVEWLKTSRYTMGNQPSLEELIDVIGAYPRRIKLYLSIKQ